MLKYFLISLAVIAVVVTLASSLQPSKPLVYRSEVMIEVPPAEAWVRLKDLSQAHCYVPGIISTDIVSATREGVGVSRRVYSADSSYIVETVTGWREGLGLDLDLTLEEGGAPLPFATATFTYELQAGGRGNTLAITQLSFIMRAGYLGAWAAKWLLAGEFQGRICFLLEVFLSYKLQGAGSAHFPET